MKRVLHRLAQHESTKEQLQIELATVKAELYELRRRQQEKLKICKDVNTQTNTLDRPEWSEIDTV